MEQSTESEECIKGPEVFLCLSVLRDIYINLMKLTKRRINYGSYF